MMSKERNERSTNTTQPRNERNERHAHARNKSCRHKLVDHCLTLQCNKNCPPITSPIDGQELKITPDMRAGMLSSFPDLPDDEAQLDLDFLNRIMSDLQKGWLIVIGQSKRELCTFDCVHFHLLSRVTFSANQNSFSITVACEPTFNETYSHTHTILRKKANKVLINSVIILVWQETTKYRASRSNISNAEGANSSAYWFEANTTANQYTTSIFIHIVRTDIYFTTSSPWLNIIRW